MNYFLKVLLCALLISPMAANAEIIGDITGVDCILNSTDEPKPFEPDEVEDDELGCRAPARPIRCSITKTSGITISGFASEDISTFEILNSDRLLVASYTDETEFVETLFSLSGDYEVLFRLDNLILRGYVSL